MNVVMALALIAYSEQPHPQNILMATGCGIAGGLLTAVFAAGRLPINESLFGILTDVKLLELSNADLPVLGQLACARREQISTHMPSVNSLKMPVVRSEQIPSWPALERASSRYR